MRLNFTRFFVGVWYKATNKVWLTAVEGVHQFTKRNKVNRRYSFATTSLLLLLAIIFGSCSRLARVLSPQVN
jgi:hypothetical protein